MAGCSGAKVIVAINKDAEANIFKEARYGVVGDWETVLPALTAALKELTQAYTASNVSLPYHRWAQHIVPFRPLFN